MTTDTDHQFILDAITHGKPISATRAAALVAELEAAQHNAKYMTTKVAEIDTERLALLVELAAARAALVMATDDNALCDIVQGELGDLGIRTRLDTGESLRVFCNGISGRIIDAMRAHYAAARKGHSQ